ncbi:MAG: murein biosynthesis integral membrane protein MurJ [Nitrospirae bacterium CG_4_10_14_3_um_filter_44_29]|nr:MAG: murein biosynthesis integral membrane protein MurJ [Nitrospirae bacterium CG22_combo_CG10-13_8_21_14_all_44_11]PIV40825.1 MAG: murein biosynthesis integral membrane protein MurJ [Nitrospirae bacterium CG02_land_8_20_14_3_00_44_33]PIV67622.1 MAG: murein biosynthesis integral membrane protein MurJ [Nitrospirae bacterium CG01_land_8_20_14_3_00_44_22]PIW88401.1 MAG: murein biosynthesis integral membrane protein MurJ [Nitrospirae bacterium CG_4_8_14_3_um_filter_44_28]PIX88475.1 MAG: murein b
MDEKRNITKAAGVMSAATFISRVLGYVKDMILAIYFGATGLSDTFFVAFRIPNLLRELFAEGSMSSAFIPVLTEYHTKHGEEEAKRLVRITLTSILLVVGIVCIIGIIFAPAIVAAIAPGFLNLTEQFSMAVILTRVMFPFLLFISLAAVVMGALNTRRIFFIPALAPAMLNITIIAAVLLLAFRIFQPIVAVAVGVAAGGFVQFAFQLPAFLKTGYSLKPEYDFRHPGLKKMTILILPATMAMAVAQINIFISTILASYLPAGSITYLYYSMRLIQFPIGIFGVAMGMAVLPTLSEHAVKGDFDKLRDDFSFALRLLFFITIPAMAGLIALGEPIVNVLFQRGKFDYIATVGTAQALLFYSMGIWAIVGARVVTSSFYSMQDTKTPVKILMVTVITNIVLSLILMKPLKHSGLALANALASTVNFLLLFYFLRKKLERLGARRIIKSFLKVSFASIAMGAAGWFLLHGELWKESGRSLEKAGYLSGVIILCSVIYFVISYLLKSEEMEYVAGLVRKKIQERV